MAKSKKKNRIKLPKRLLGVKVPKNSRKSLNHMLKLLPAEHVNPLITAAVGSIVALLVERLEKPLEALAGHGNAAGSERPGPSKH